MALPPEKAWWPRKKVGYGWTWPTRWPGWAVTIAYGIGLVVSGLMNLPQYPGRFIGSLFVVTAILVALSYWKGEDPEQP